MNTVVFYETIVAFYTIRVILERLHEIDETLLLPVKFHVGLVKREAAHIFLLEPGVQCENNLVIFNRLFIHLSRAIALGAIECVALVDMFAGGESLLVRLIQNSGVILVFVRILVSCPRPA